MVMQCPELFRGGSVVTQVVANIDIAPTILEAAGLKAPNYMDGRSFLSLAEGKPVSWRDFLLYEYYWEWPFPQTPTMYALRGDQYKYIHYYGLWDTNELYDIKADPLETRNLITSPQHQQVVNQFGRQLFEILKEPAACTSRSIRHDGQQNLTTRTGSKAAEFPPHLIKKSN